MAKCSASPTIGVTVTFTVNEDEARALDALAWYSTDEFIKWFYENLGSYYMKPHEDGMRSFLDTIRSEVCPALRRVDKARKVFEEPTS